MLQNELEVDFPELAISIVGINEDGHASGNDSATTGRDIPWLQDTVEQSVWSRWQPGFRDVIIVDSDGVYYATYNLTAHNLATTANYEELKALLVDALTP